MTTRPTTRTAAGPADIEDVRADHRRRWPERAKTVRTPTGDDAGSPADRLPRMMIG